MSSIDWFKIWEDAINTPSNNSEISDEDKTKKVEEIKKPTKEEIYRKYWLHELYIEKLAQRKIDVAVQGSRLIIDTEEVYHWITDEKWNIHSEKIDELSLDWKLIIWIDLQNNWTTIFSLVDKNTWEISHEYFSEKNFEEDEYKDFLELWKEERLNYYRLEEIKNKIQNPESNTDENWLNNHLTNILEEKWIKVLKNPDWGVELDTYDLNKVFIDWEWEIHYWKISGFNMERNYLDQLWYWSDWDITLDLIDKKTWNLTRYVFTDKKFEDTTETQKDYFKRQLEEIN